ncbi:MAG TPA: methyltransferase [Candidatus Scatomonas pullistercoris]|uniref:Methyltransferase n=1 Tax=Candidatus Scatomonas pullistercoris TaxID=2840920 RepID=A0A9D1TBI4_9FIRM|nr:methyltransferase [Candidatus Scatomonas pullistercoris]
MTGRERLIATLNHQQPDRTVIDLGGTSQTGINASTLYRFRKALGLPEKPIKITEPGQLLGEVDYDVINAVGADVIGLLNPVNFFGYKNENWKPWQMDDGTPVLMGGGFEYDEDEKGTKYVYPQGDRSAEYSCMIPKGGSFFDSVPREKFDFDLDEEDLTPLEDFKEDFSVVDDETAKYWEQKSYELYNNTDLGVVGMLGGGALGDAAVIPGPAVKHPRGIRRVDDWLMAHAMYPDYIKAVFRYQTDVMLKNLEIYKQAVGERIQVVWISGTDFGNQRGPMISLSTFRELYKPFYKEICDWVHQNTGWKTFFHTCGAIYDFLDDFAEMGLDCLNPLQLSANGMDPVKIKENYGDKFTFWGGGVDTQHVLPFGTPDEVRAQVRERIDILGKGGGYVFNTIHNIVAGVPAENLMAMYDEAKK